MALGSDTTGPIPMALRVAFRTRLFIVVILTVITHSSACAQSYLSIPSDLRELPDYSLPGSRYGLLHGSPGILHFAKPVAGHSQLLNALLSQGHSIEMLSITSATWSRASSMNLADEDSWSFIDAARIDCPAPHCLLLGGPVQWLVTTDADFNMIDSALVSAMESSYSEDLKRQSEKAVLDSNFGWGGEQATYPLDFAASGIFCSTYYRRPEYDVPGDAGDSKIFMRQVMSDGRVLARELSSWSECVGSNPLASPED